jgi:nitronate monooxygenase
MTQRGIGRAGNAINGRYRFETGIAMKTLTELIGTALPIVQAPMAGVQGSALAVAVSQAGALGSLPCAMLAPAAMREELAAVRAGTRGPFNVNFFCHAQPEPDAARERRWRHRLGPALREFGLDPAAIPEGPGRQPFDEAAADLLEAVRPPVVSFHFGLPAAGLLARVKAMGAVVLSSATTVDEARWLRDHGADAIVAQGLEAGGHRGIFLGNDLATQQGLFALLPQVARAVDVPVIAAGGIVDAAGVAAAFALGAAGVQAGTAFLLCPEAKTSALHRAALREADARGTALTNLFTGRPARGLVNRMMREYGPIDAAAPAFPLAGTASGALRAAAEARGSGEFSPLWAGQNAAGCREVAAAEVLAELARGVPPGLLARGGH